MEEEEIKQKYPLHYSVWNKDEKSLKRLLKDKTKNFDINQKDPRHRTPLMLAVTLGHKECALILLEHNALVNVTDATGFNVLHEAVTTADPAFIKTVYLKKELQRYYSIRVDGMPNLMSKLKDTTDFYLEMKWEFTSWVPLISRLCPSDTYKIYKRGSKVRVDTTLVGMDDATNWQRGNKTMIFEGSEDGGLFLEVDHDEKNIMKRNMQIIKPNQVNDYIEITEELIAERLTNPIKTTFIDTEQINFERAKSGIYGFRTDRTEFFDGYECKVFLANNVEFLTKTRIEHLTQNDKDRYKMIKDSSTMASLKTLIGISEQTIVNPFVLNPPDSEWFRNPYKLNLIEYFNSLIDSEKDIGCARELNIKRQHYKANLWISDDYPLSLQEQILPIVDMMSISSSHFAKLKEFIACKLPSGFPIKIEIPLFHLLNARITFGNVFAINESVVGVKYDAESGRCTVDESCFEPPEHYQTIGFESDHSIDHFQDGAQSDDEYLKYILQQYEHHPTKFTAKKQSCPERLKSQDSWPENVIEGQSDNDEILQRAIQMSLQQMAISNGQIGGGKMINDCNNSSQSSNQSCDNSTINAHQQQLTHNHEEMMKETLKQSKIDHEEYQNRIEKEEQEIMERVLKLSLIEK